MRQAIITKLAFSTFKVSALLFLCVFFPLSAVAQKLPDKIRGYKVYQADISVRTADEKSKKTDKSEAFVKVGEPDLVDVSITGITFELSAEIDSVAQNGKIDFLTFHDFRVNGLSVEVEEYKIPFELKKNQPVILPKPAKIFLATTQTLRGAIKEIRDSKDEWLVTGKVFVFGRFKKFGMNFKRVIPVDVNIKIQNPIKPKISQTDK